MLPLASASAHLLEAGDVGSVTVRSGVVCTCPLLRGCRPAPAVRRPVPTPSPSESLRDRRTPCSRHPRPWAPLGYRRCPPAPPVRPLWTLRQMSSSMCTPEGAAWGQPRSPPGWHQPRRQGPPARPWSGSLSDVPSFMSMCIPEGAACGSSHHGVGLAHSDLRGAGVKTAPLQRCGLVRADAALAYLT